MNWRSIWSKAGVGDLVQVLVLMLEFGFLDPTFGDHTECYLDTLLVTSMSYHSHWDEGNRNYVLAFMHLFSSLKRIISRW